MASPDKSNISLGDLVVPPEEPILDIQKSFEELFKETTLFFQSFLVREANSEEYGATRLKGSDEEVVFYK